MVCAEVVLHLFAERLHSFVWYLQRHYLGPSHFARYASQQSQIARTLVFTKRLNMDLVHIFEVRHKEEAM